MKVLMVAFGFASKPGIVWMIFNVFGGKDVVVGIEEADVWTLLALLLENTEASSNGGFVRYERGYPVILVRVQEPQTIVLALVSKGVPRSPDTLEVCLEIHGVSVRDVSHIRGVGPGHTHVVGSPFKLNT